MTPTCCTMPTAVITESSEKTMSSAMIWASTAPYDAATRADFSPSGPSSRPWISCVLFATRKSPPTISTRSRPLISAPVSGTAKSGFVRPMIQESDSRSRIRMIIARPRPTR